MSSCLLLLLLVLRLLPWVADLNILQRQCLQLCQHGEASQTTLAADGHMLKV
jgi:hypothetical protein